jgi:hypothetical protein
MVSIYLPYSMYSNHYSVQSKKGKEYGVIQSWKWGEPIVRTNSIDPFR